MTEIRRLFNANEGELFGESAQVAWDAILEGRAANGSFLQELMRDFTETDVLYLAAEIFAHHERPIWIGPSPISSERNPNFADLSWRAAATGMHAMMHRKRTMSAMSIPARDGGVGRPAVAILLGSPEGASIVIRARPSMRFHTHFGIGHYEFTHKIDESVHERPMGFIERHWVVTKFFRDIVFDRAHKIAKAMHEVPQ